MTSPLITVSSKAFPVRSVPGCSALNASLCIDYEKVYISMPAETIGSVVFGRLIFAAYRKAAIILGFR
jgi:hypothetical protein